VLYEFDYSSITPWAAAKLLPAFDTSAKSIQFLT